MRANMRCVSSTDEIFFVRIASAACKAVAKSSACGVEGAEFCAMSSCFAAVVAANISKAGKVDAARASGAVARKSRRFICEMVKGARRTRNPKRGRMVQRVGNLTRLFKQFHGSSREHGKEAPFRYLYFSYLSYFYLCRTPRRLR